MINVLLLEKDMIYGKQLINKLAAKNKDFRLCGITNNRKEAILILNRIKIDIVLVDLSLNECQKMIKLIDERKYKNVYILILNKNIDINIINDVLKKKAINYIIKSNDISKDIDNISSLFISKETIQLSKKSKIKELKIKEKIYKELKCLGYNLQHFGSKYLCETIYILYVAKDYYDNNLERDIYPIIAKKFGKSVNNIKCNIKNATEIMYYENEEEKIMKYLGNCYFMKPQPKKIILAILKKIQ